MSEFWESTYKGNEKMWGEDSTDNAKHVLRLFQRHNIKSILIPGFGYGRNARVFYDKGFDVSGIEISKTAIARAQKYFGNDVTIHHGSVNDMPFDHTHYEAIYCYSLVHLLNQADRLKLIEACYSQLEPGGLMVFVALSTNDNRFGVGDEIEVNTFHTPHGLNLYFYDKASMRNEFGRYTIIDLKEINEPEQNSNEKHWMVVCKKPAFTSTFKQ